MLKHVRNVHRSFMKKIKNIECNGTFEKKNKNAMMLFEKKSLAKLNANIKEIKKHMLYDPNTFD